MTDRRADQLRPVPGQAAQGGTTDPPARAVEPELRRPVARPQWAVGAWERYHTLDAPVRGGNLRVGVWEPAADAAGEQVPTIVAVHGITASHRAWVNVVPQLPEFRVLAPDLRGRGRSNFLPGPFGLAQHADDIAAVLDHLGIESAPVVGHSMGAFVTVVARQRYPDRIGQVVLVDGGVPMPLPEGFDASRDVSELLAKDASELLAKSLGPAAERLTMSFPDPESYRTFWHAHPAFAAAWSDAVLDYVDYDLTGVAPQLFPATHPDAMAADYLDLYGSPDILRGLEQLAGPTIFLRAPRGFVDDPPGIWPPYWMEEWAKRIPALRVQEVPGVNHYTILFIDPGVTAIVSAIRRTVLGQAVPQQGVSGQAVPAPDA